MQAARGRPAQDSRRCGGLAGSGETENAPGRVGASLAIASRQAGADDCETARRLLGDVLEESRQVPGNHRATTWGYAISDVYSQLGQPDEPAWALRQTRDQVQVSAVEGTAVGNGKVAAKWLRSRAS